MASDSVDDRYVGCRDQAFETFIKGGLLDEELKLNTDFSKAWIIEEACLKQKPETSKEHLTALTAHNSEDQKIIADFNQAVKTLGANATLYKEKFHFKAFHFLLMDSMRKQQPKDCKTVYAVPGYRYSDSKGSKVRLGQFLKAYSSFSYLGKMMDLEGSLVFNITSCFFAKMGADVCSAEDAVLLSPAEVFTLENFEKVNEKEKETEYEVITLKHAGLFSYHNCYIFSR